MQNKKIKVVDVFKSTSKEEIDRHLREKIVKILINRQSQEIKAV